MNKRSPSYTWVSSFVGALVPVAGMMLAVNNRVMNNYSSSMKTYEWIAFGIFTLYLIVEFSLLMMEEKRIQGVRRFAGLAGGALIAFSFAIAAAKTTDNAIIDDMYINGNLGSNITEQQAAFASVYPKKTLYDEDCADVRMSPSFGDYGVSGTRLSNAMFIFGLTIVSVAATSLYGTKTGDVGEFYDAHSQKISGFVCFVMTALGVALFGITLSRLPENIHYLDSLRTRDHGIYETRTALLSLLIAFLVATLLNDIYAKVGRGLVATRNGRVILSTLVEYLSMLAMVAAIVGVGMMIHQTDQSAAAKRYRQLTGSTMADAKSAVGDVLPGASVCVVSDFGDYQMASGSLSSLVAVGVLYTWRCIYAPDYTTPADNF